MSGLWESRTLSDLLRRQARQPEAAALTYGDRMTSYAALDRRANQVANGLAGLGVGRHDRVGYLGKNSDLYFELLFGTIRAGAALVPVNWQLAVPEIAVILADAGINMLFLGKGFGAVPPALDKRGGLRCISMDGASEDWLARHRRCSRCWRV